MPAARVIELDDVRKVHSTSEVSVEALRGVSFVVGEGEFVAIMGPSGSGKTTLLGILGCLDRPTTGSYRLVGQEMSKLSETRRAHVRGERIGFVYAGVRTRERRRRALEALAEVGLADRADHLPSQLSGGEQQRVAIARALVVHPSVVLADEPTGNLDSKNAEEVLTLLERMNAHGATIVMVTHSRRVAERASRILRIEDGLMVADEPIARGSVLEVAQ
jgi:putative ABC transport system ATP-binding protein